MNIDVCVIVFLVLASGLAWIAPGVKAALKIWDDDDLRFRVIRKERDRLHETLSRGAKRRGMKLQEYAAMRGISSGRDLRAAALLVVMLRLALQGWCAPITMRRMANET